MGCTVLAVGRRQTTTARPNGPAADAVCTAGTDSTIGIIGFKANEASGEHEGGVPAAAAGKCLPSRPAVAPRQASTSRPGSKISNISIAVHRTYRTIVKL